MKYDENFEILWNFWVLKFYIFFLIFKFSNFLKLLNFNFFFWNILTPYRWYIDPHTHGISTPLPMVFWPPYPWYIDPPTHGILNPLLMVYRPPYPWYFDPSTHRILTPLHMIFWPLCISWLEMGGGSKYHGGSIYHTGGVQFSIRGFNIPWM